MDLGLGGKSVLVTGGSKGIGLACARAFLAEGARVGIVSRSQANISSAIQALGEGAWGYSADLSQADEAAEAVTAFADAFGHVDVLVNSAGAARRTPPDDLTPAHWRDAMDAKYFSYVNVIDPVVKRMGGRRSGVIVNVIGNGGKAASPIHLPGGAANAALMLVTAGLASAYADRGVRVVGVNPGLTDTDRVSEGLAAEAAAKSLSIDDAHRQAVARIPIGRMASPDEVAATVVFLASARASYITGVTITMDGAQTSTIV